MDEVDLVFGNVDKPRLVQQIVEWRGEHAVPCAIGDEADYISPRIGRTRAMVKIQEGCNQVCAYCIVPKVRGRERSIPTEALVGEIQLLAAKGYKEVVLTGTQLGSYGFDLVGASLGLLIATILSRCNIERLRVSSLQPREITDDLLALWSDKRLCPHFHMPLQSGSNSILRMMRRRYTAEDYVETVKRIRERIPQASITADVIVGFPGETDADFRATYELCESIGFADLHMFPYSMRPGTSAAYYDDQLEFPAKSERMHALLNLGKSMANQFRQGSLGTVRSVLWESQIADEGAIQWTGLTDNYIRVKSKSNLPLLNVIAPAMLASLDVEGTVRAEIV
ncbi:Threonylcarbamoyladenosine tRNA methylthiotransferase MtaB [Geodia barretti]|uniref:Threonylcarbamoyladenosine tRNA methylthiotransferase MtaB n=1 Tax=Geodia barretti TaxID=519541 RepID=A0AA35T5L9_GEOBA|nr:Threonylcarbamoyladenosine tRNA methylthiotransferase MtaB [Geodia barretti]